MYRSYWDDKTRSVIFEYHFSNLNDFLNYIQEKERNSHVFGERSSVTGSYRFTKTATFDEAVRFCQYGWTQDFDRLLKLKEKVDQYLIKKGQETIKRSKTVMGFAPSMSDIVTGNPLNMWQIQKQPNFDIIKIYVSLSYPGHTTSSEIYNRGAILLSLVDILEKMGYGVELIPFEICYEEDYVMSRTKTREYLIAYFSLKDSSENLNLGKVYFPLCHPSFVRRLLFALKEVTPFKVLRWEDSYGHVCEPNHIREVIGISKDEILFSSPRDMNISGDNVYEDLENILETLQLERFFKRNF